MFYHLTVRCVTLNVPPKVARDLRNACSLADPANSHVSADTDQTIHFFNFYTACDTKSLTDSLSSMFKETEGLLIFILLIINEDSQMRQNISI